MMKVQSLKFISFLVLAGFLMGGTGSGMASEAKPPASPSAVAEKKDANVLKGKIVGVSKKAKSISIVVGKDDKAQTIMVKFDESTKGMDHAQKGEAAIINYELRGTEKYAVVVKPKLAKLPPGVTEMQPDELVMLVAMGPEKGGYFLVDSRPAPRFAAGHIPTSVSIPVEIIAEKGAELLPVDKDTPLIFHCGGPT